MKYVQKEHISGKKFEGKSVYVTIFTWYSPNSKANTKFGKYILLMSLCGKHWSTDFWCGCQVLLRSIAFEASLTHSLYVGVFCNGHSMSQMRHQKHLYREPPACKPFSLLGSFNRPKYISWKYPLYFYYKFITKKKKKLLSSDFFSYSLPIFQSSTFPSSRV